MIADAKVGMREPTPFARISWMQFYNGPREERPQGCGSNNRKHLGSELLNFRPVKECLCGFFNSGSGKTEINLPRLDSASTGKEALDNVTVIFAAIRPTLLVVAL